MKTTLQSLCELLKKKRELLLVAVASLLTVGISTLEESTGLSGSLASEPMYGAMSDTPMYGPQAVTFDETQVQTSHVSRQGRDVLLERAAHRRMKRTAIAGAYPHASASDSSASSVDSVETAVSIVTELSQDTSSDTPSPLTP